MKSQARNSTLETADEHPIVRVSGFEKRYKTRIAAQGVDLTVNPGELYGLIGPDGAGKSSLMKAVAGVLSFEAGTVEVLGIMVDSERAAERIKHRIGFLPQGLGHNLYPELSVEENVDFFARLRLVPDDELAARKRRLLAMTRLDRFRDRAMKHLSGGMKQKLGLVCTLIHEPQLAILDEPTTGVDPVSRRDFWAILSELLQERHMTALVSTAYMDEAARFHRLSFMSRGSVLASGTPGELHALAPGTIVTFQASAQGEARARLQRDFRQVESLGSRLHVFVAETDAECAANCVRQSLGDIHADSLQVEQPELEDVFVSLLLQQRDRVQPSLTQPLGATESLFGRAMATTDSAAYDHRAVEARDLVRDFGSFRAVDRVSFRIKSGEIFGLLGANGAGKTTVIKMLTGILQPTGGQGTIAGADMRRAGQSIKQRIGYMSQAFSLYLDLTVLENIRLFAGVYGLGKREREERLDWIVRLASLEGYETTLTGGLPMGVRQRLALGCALIHCPLVLFLDEPTSGVDPIGRRHFWEILSQLAREQGVAILVTTHYVVEAEHCDHLALMHAGRVVASGSPAEMKDQVEREAGQLLEVLTNRPARAMALLDQHGFTGATLFGTRLHLLSRNPEVDTDKIYRTLAGSGVDVLSVAPRPLSLEDVFCHRIMGLERQDRTPVQGASR